MLEDGSCALCMQYLHLLPCKPSLVLHALLPWPCMAVLHGPCMQDRAQLPYMSNFHLCSLQGYAGFSR